jgi:hypothetical protein
MSEPLFMKHGVYIMATETISTAYFINPSHQSVSVFVSILQLLGKGSVKGIPHFIARQRLGKHVPAARNACKNRRVIGRDILYAVNVLTKVSQWVRQCISLSLLGNNSVKLFPRLRIIVRCVVVYSTHIASEEIGD